MEEGSYVTARLLAAISAATILRTVPTDMETPQPGTKDFLNLKRIEITLVRPLMTDLKD